MDAMALPDPDPTAPFPAAAGLAEAQPVNAAGAARLPPPRHAIATQRIGWRTGIALCILAFLGGLALMALIAVRFGATFGTAKPVATVTVPVEPGGQTPVVIVPTKTVTAAATLDLAALSGREVELGARLAEIEARAGAIDQASAQASGYATRAEGLMIAFAARRALDRGLNLGFLEGQLKDRFGGSQPRAVATILQAAHNPVTLEDLRAGLDGVAPQLTTGGVSWASFQRELGHLVVLRRAGTPSPLPIDRVARARRLLEAGQVEAALAEVSRTPGAAKAEGWTGAARRYLVARGALNAIESAAILTPQLAPAAASATSAAPAPRADVPGLGATPPNR